MAKSARMKKRYPVPGAPSKPGTPTDLGFHITLEGTKAVVHVHEGFVFPTDPVALKRMDDEVNKRFTKLNEEIKNSRKGSGKCK